MENPKTFKKLRLFQRANHLEDKGKLDAITMEMLFGIVSVPDNGGGEEGRKNDGNNGGGNDGDDGNNGNNDGGNNDGGNTDTEEYRTTSLFLCRW